MITAIGPAGYESLWFSLPFTIYHTTDRATNLNLMVALNAYTLCSGVICEELNGPDFVAVPFLDDHENPNSVMEIGYLTKKGMSMSEPGQRFIEEIRQYLQGYHACTGHSAGDF